MPDPTPLTHAQRLDLLAEHAGWFRNSSRLWEHADDDDPYRVFVRKYSLQEIHLAASLDFIAAFWRDHLPHWQWGRGPHAGDDWVAVHRHGERPIQRVQETGDWHHDLVLLTCLCLAAQSQQKAEPA